MPPESRARIQYLVVVLAETPTLTVKVLSGLGAMLAQSAEQGAWPTLFAATAPGLPGDSYVGAGGFLEQRGHPRLVGRNARARDRDTARRLWRVSEQLTGVVYPLDAR